MTWGSLDSTVNAAHLGEYVIGAVKNQLTLTVKQADKLTADLTFMGLTYSPVTQSVGLLSTAAVSAGSAANAPAVAVSGGCVQYFFHRCRSFAAVSG